jgi:hypothetical protein
MRRSRTGSYYSLSLLKSHLRSYKNLATVLHILYCVGILSLETSVLNLGFRIGETQSPHLRTPNPWLNPGSHPPPLLYNKCWGDPRDKLGVWRSEMRAIGFKLRFRRQSFQTLRSILEQSPYFSVGILGHLKAYCSLP